ncbi:tyrosine-type recombinase/integrase [Methylohalobius crimeensis]|uniref:tyrosine-type recombinase/integrase n=1 Tax=Methylohalobius crimeensis TaxID=244365 RepID=UPI0003B2F469|nr:site-specific integrase [Methylohalobius crimeensis]
MPNGRKNTNRVKFTAGRVAEFKCPPGKSEATLWDAEVSGLGLRVTKNDKRAYVFKFSLRGKSGRYRIGRQDAFDIAQARAEARRLRTLVDAGIHPGEEKRRRELEAEVQRQEEERAEVTLGEAWDAYIEARRKDWSARTLRDHEKMMQPPGQPRERTSQKTKAGPLWALRGEALADLTPEGLMQWLNQEKRTRPTSTAGAFRLLRAFLNWTTAHPDYRGLVDVAALLNGNVRRAVPKPRTKDDCLQREQLRTWFDAVRQIPHPSVSAYLQALLLTGARREEMASLRWADVDFQWRSMTLKDKIDGERIVPLTPYLAQVLDALPRRNEFVFYSGTSSSGKLATPNHPHSKALARAGLPHLTLHGLRRSFGTLAEWTEAPVGVVAQIMGHKPSALAEKHYRRRPLDLLRLWHSRIEGWILEQAGIEHPQDGGTGLRVVGKDDN